MFSENYGKKTISVGPWGGQDGFHWDDGVHTTVRQIEIAHGAGIDSVRIEYDLNGASVRLEKHGGSGGAKTDKVNLKYPEEFLTSIHGYYGSLQEWGPVFVRSLTFDSNKRRYGPYGIEEGTPFSIPNAGAKVVGFHGKCGWYLDAIGAYIQPLHQPVPSNSMIHSGNYFAHGREKYEYALIHGNLGQNYDLVVTLRQRDNFYNNGSAPIGSVSRQSSNSRELGHMETMNKISSVPPQIERVPSKTVTGVVTYGPWGGAGGTVFDDGIYDGIRQINLSRNVRIVSIRVCYEQNGQPIWGTKNGGTGGFKTDKIIFDYPSEILTHITGYYGPTMIMGPNIIKSLTFHTTKTKHGPFGVEQGQSFSTDLKQGMILGFHGRKGLFLDAIGVHVVEGKVESKLVSHSNSFNRQDSSSSEGDDSKRFLKIGKKGLMEQAVQRVVQGPSPCGPGPWGGDGGKPWDDGVFTGIKQIILTRKTEAICSIEIEYDRNGQSVWSVKHGGNAGETPIRVKLEYPHEVVTCISGHYGPLNKSGEGTNVIKSLTFHTSRRKCGPFGDEVGTFFTSTTAEGKVVGFHGRSGFYLDAIGVHMQHWFGNQRKPSSFMKFFS